VEAREPTGTMLRQSMTLGVLDQPFRRRRSIVAFEQSQTIFEHDLQQLAK
jgi:hypothetical protein